MSAEVLEATGVRLAVKEIKAPDKLRRPVPVATKPYPGGPQGLKMGFIEGWLGDESSGRPVNEPYRRPVFKIPDPYDPANKPKPQGPDFSL